MSSIRSFPNGGYEVTVHKKQDILDCIEENIIDTDVALAIVEQCERDAIEFLNNGKWSAIPFIGNLRVPKIKEVDTNEEKQEMLKDAKEVLSSEQYLLFKKKVYGEEMTHIKFERYYNYITSILSRKYKSKFRQLCKTKGEAYAKVIMYSYNYIKVIGDNHLNLLLNNDGQ